MAPAELFQLDGKGHLAASAGVPPDAFSDQGQLWGNPLYDWKGNKQGVFDFWKRRIQWCAAIYDAVRIDHFRAFHSYWSVPTGAENAREGIGRMDRGWSSSMPCKNPPPSWSSLRRTWGTWGPKPCSSSGTCGIPGMKVMVFAFDPVGESAYLPHNCQRDSVIYTGTHDTPTFLQWLRETDPDSRLFASRYLRLRRTRGWLGRDLRRLAAPSRLAIAPSRMYWGWQRRSDDTPGTMGQPELAAGGSVRRPSNPTSSVTA